MQLTRVTYLRVEDSNADLKLYQSGEEDLMQQLPPGSYNALKAQYPEGDAQRRGCSACASTR